MSTATGCSRSRPASPDATRAVRSFWLMGLMNNSPWVLMLAVATNISAGGVALVFLSNQIPGLVVKITAPYWFHLTTYRLRMLLASASMGVACFLVGCGGLFRDQVADGDGAGGDGPGGADGQGLGLALELLGVSFVSFSCNLGEASLLALAGKFDSVILPKLAPNDSYRRMYEEHAGEDPNCAEAWQIGQSNLFEEECDLNGNISGTLAEENDAAKLMKKDNIHERKSITAFSSGTGLAGIVGYGYKALLSDLFGWGLSSTVWSAMLFALAYWITYLRGLHDVEQRAQQETSRTAEAGNGEFVRRPSDLLSEALESSQLVSDKDQTLATSAVSSLEIVDTEISHNVAEQKPDASPCEHPNVSPHDLTSIERFKFVLSLWPYTIPLFTVYAAEYMLQAGVWSAVGFPVTSANARAEFYHYSNWTYQAGVFLSRSSGNLCSASIRTIWLMPFLQVCNLYFFWFDSIHHFWYNYSLLLPCFFAGLLGGGVYVQGYSRVNMDMPVEMKEFAIASVAVADSLGILLADICSLFIQSCIYKENNIRGAVVDCPY